jgi:hypothetical protein
MGDTGEYGGEDLAGVRPLRSVLIKNTDDFQILFNEKRFYSGQTHKIQKWLP